FELWVQVRDTKGTPLAERSLTVQKDGTRVAGKEPANKNVQLNLSVPDKEQTWNAALQLIPGEYQVEVRGKNEWYEEIAQTRLAYRYLPRIDQPITPVQVGDKPLVDFTAQVKTSPDREPNAVKINGRPLPKDKDRYTFEKKAEKDGIVTWQLS